MFNKRTLSLYTVKFFQDSNSLFGLLREDKTCLILLKMLSDIAFEQIEGNFWYGAYGEFRVVMMKDNVFINATKRCKDGGKEYTKWSRLQNSRQLIEELERHQALENNQASFGIPNFTLQDANSQMWLLASPPCIFVKTANNTPT